MYVVAVACYRFMSVMGIYGCWRNKLSIKALPINCRTLLKLLFPQKQTKGSL